MLFSNVQGLQVCWEEEENCRLSVSLFSSGSDPPPWSTWRASYSWGKRDDASRSLWSADRCAAGLRGHPPARLPAHLTRCTPAHGGAHLDRRAHLPCLVVPPYCCLRLGD